MISNLNSTPKGERIHIALFGRRNVGKSSLINAITNQTAALVSDVAGTTTDPVFKSMEILPIGPVVIIDTAGIDDIGELGRLRVEKTYEVMAKTDVAIVVINASIGADKYELDIINELKERKINFIVVINKIDEINYDERIISKINEKLCLKDNVIAVSVKDKHNIESVKEALIRVTPYDESEMSIVGDLIQGGDFVVLVTPIDKAAPKGRLILPQQQVIRDIIDHDAIAIVTKEHELKETLDNLGKKPTLVITDSQAFLKVSADTPLDIKMTSFSILFARYKGELGELVSGAKAIEKLKAGDKVLVVEGCTHHRQSDDIGTVKIPRWIRQIAGGNIDFEFSSGNSMPKNLENYKLIVHCGACMLNKKDMLYRIEKAREKDVPIVNYGVVIAYVHGILERALEPFPLVKALYMQ